MRDENQTAVFNVKCILRTRTNIRLHVTTQYVPMYRLNRVLRTYLIH